MLRCPRAHYWQYEIGLRRESSGLALRVGSAWARGMEARWKDANFDEALAAACNLEDLDAYAAATVAGLLTGYYRYYGERETVGHLNPEVQFDYKLKGSRTFSAAGKLDGLGSLSDGRSVIVEAKTTSDSLAPESSYWLRLRFNPQILQYVSAVRAAGWQISEVIYDVTRKPCIKPKQITDCDSSGLKIVLDRNGNRVFKTNGEPRQTCCEADGHTLKSHLETPDEFADRLIADIASRPDFYFCRREIPILDDDLDDFVDSRLEIADRILRARKREKRFVDNPERAWVRNVDQRICNCCSYASFCLQNIKPNLEEPPEGFSIQPFNPELADTSVTEETNTPI